MAVHAGGSSLLHRASGEHLDIGPFGQTIPGMALGAKFFSWETQLILKPIPMEGVTGEAGHVRLGEVGAPAKVLPLLAVAPSPVIGPEVADLCGIRGPRIAPKVDEILNVCISWKKTYREGEVALSLVRVSSMALATDLILLEGL